MGDLSIQPGECPAAWMDRMAATGGIPAIIPILLEGSPTIVSGGIVGPTHSRMALDPRPQLRAAVAIHCCVTLHREVGRMPGVEPCST